MAKYIISADSSADYLKGFLDEHGIYCIPVKHIFGETEYGAIFESAEQIDKEFYERMKTQLPTTAQINPAEFTEYFEKIFKETSEGDIIHVSLSSAASGSYNSAVSAAADLEKKHPSRKIYVVDSLHFTSGEQMLVNLLIKLNGNTAPEDAVKQVIELRDHTQTYFIVDDLGHLKRGGRLSAGAALIGKLLGVKPILTIGKNGKPVVESKAIGMKKAVHYIVEQLKKQAASTTQDYAETELHLLRSTESQQYENCKALILEKYPHAHIIETKIGPVIGAHVGQGTVAVIFRGRPRLDIK